MGYYSERNFVIYEWWYTCSLWFQYSKDGCLDGVCQYEIEETWNDKLNVAFQQNKWTII